jgi:hypothetical protein
VIITQHFVVTRGDAKDFTLTMPAGAELLSAESVRFTARDVGDEVVWEQTLTPSSDTVAVASLAAADWTTWDSANEPQELRFDFQIVDADGETHTEGQGIIKVVGDQSR